MHDREISLTFNISFFRKDGGKHMTMRETSMPSNLSPYLTGEGNMHGRETSLTSNRSYSHKEGGKHMTMREISMPSNLSPSLK